MNESSPQRAFKDAIKLLSDGKTVDTKKVLEIGLSNADRNKDKVGWYEWNGIGVLIGSEYTLGKWQSYKKEKGRIGDVTK